MPIAVRAWLRYLVPLAVLCALPLAPAAWIALHVPAATDVAQARVQLRIGWILVGTAPLFQLLAVAAAAPAVRGLVLGRPLSQLGALAAGARSLVHGVVPWAIAAGAIVLGGLALAVPGLVLLVLLATTCASEPLDAPLPAPLVDGIAAVRARWKLVAAVVAAVVALDVAIGVAAQLEFVRALPVKPPVAALVSVRTFVRVVGLALVATASIPASLLAAIRTETRSRIS